MTLDIPRFNALISPLRRALLSAARRRESLPEIPETQVEILRKLPRGTSSTPALLAAELQLSRSSVSNLLTTMQSRGLIARSSSTTDRRSVHIAASDRALSIMERFEVASGEILERAADSLTPDDQAVIADALPALERLRYLLAKQGASEDKPTSTTTET